MPPDNFNSQRDILIRTDDTKSSSSLLLSCLNHWVM